MKPTTSQVAVFGGSFNPPHIGHVFAALYALSTVQLDKLLVIPAWKHPLAKSIEAYEHRFKMCELAMENLKRVEISRIEEELDGPSWTLETLEALYRRFPQTQFRLVIGSDILTETEKWFQFDRILQISPPIIIPRGGYLITNASEFRLPEISSSKIRQLLKANCATQGLLPDSVLKYIEQHKLYQNK
jgi:nicotinate-nucleotide adenylyltransferase